VLAIGIELDWVNPGLSDIEFWDAGELADSEM
jgi:hypothetical protein